MRVTRWSPRAPTSEREGRDTLAGATRTNRSVGKLEAITTTTRRIYYMSVADALLELAAAQRKLVALLQAEYFCDDLELPDSAFGWDERKIRAYYEAGGDA